MIVEISNKKENYLNSLGLLKDSKLSRKNSIRLIANNNRFQFNMNNVENELNRRKQPNYLSKRTLKANRIANGKNLQEEKRLQLASKQIDKNYSIEDYIWLTDFINMKTKLKEIETKSNRESSLKSTCEAEYYAQINHNDFIRKINSYTSLIGPENDRIRDGISQELSRKRPQSSLDFNKYIDEVNKNALDNQEATEKFKSIRRPLMRTGSIVDVEIKVKSLKAKVDFCRDKSEIECVKHDRNIRYGEPLPKCKIYRQLRIISKVDDIIR